MHNLTEINVLVVVCLIAGFVSGVLFGIIDDIAGLLLRERRINTRSIVSKSIFTGLAMGTILSLINFAFASMTAVSTQELIRTTIGSATGIALCPIVANLIGLVSSKLFPEQ
ncbi:MAG: hypothetical protein RLZZ574_2375 [Cyanobacteriota bacterium]